MGHEDDASTCIGEMLDGWDRALNAAVIGDVAVIVERHIEVDAHEDTFPGRVDIADGEFGHFAQGG